MQSDLKNIQDLFRKRNISDISDNRDLPFNAIKTVWITLNRSCNFRCPHCYAKDTISRETLEMSLTQVKKLVDFSKDIGAKIIILIGGEPLLYKDLFSVLDYIRQKDLISAIATNGYLLSDPSFLEKIHTSSLGSLGLSIKAGNAKLHEKLTQTNSFEKIKSAISNFEKLTSEWNSYNVVLTKDTLTDLPNIARLVSNDKNKVLRISFCSPIIEASGKINGNSMLEIHEIISYLTQHYSEINTILKGRLLIQQSLPRCFWPKEFIESLEKRKQISFSCHLYNRTGLAFDTKGRMLLCNSVPNYTIAQFGKDFTTAEEFRKFFMQKDVCNLYKNIFRYPAKRCTTCPDYPKCLGGCPLLWFYYSGTEIDEMQENNAQINIVTKKDKQT